MFINGKKLLVMSVLLYSVTSNMLFLCPIVFIRFSIQYKIRKESLSGLGQIYKRCMMKEDRDPNEMEQLGWIRNKVLYAYYQNSMEDKYMFYYDVHC